MTNDAPPSVDTLTATKLRGHIPVLDGLRGFALILVLFHHFTDMTPVGAFDRAVSTTIHHGAIAIDLFFVLSGFLITGILAQSRGRAGYFKCFYARRILRVFPLYYLIVVFSFLVLPNIGPLLAGAPGVSGANAELVQSKLDRFGAVQGDEWYYWTYLSNFAVAKADAFRHGILAVSWSLSIEEQFYLLWPLLIAAMGLLRTRWVCISLIVLSPLFRLWFLSLDVDPLFGGAPLIIDVMMMLGLLDGIQIVPLIGSEPSVIDVLMLTPGRLEGIALGSLLALHLRGGTGEHEPGRRLTALIPIARVVGPVCLLGAMAIELPRYLGTHEGIDPSHLAATLGMFLVPLGFAGAFVLALDARPGGVWYRLWTSRVLCSFGKYSYAIYLLHLPIRAVIRDVFFGPRVQESSGRFGTALIEFPTIMGSELPGQLLFYIPAFGVCWVVGWLSWHVFEKHFLKMKKYFPYPKREAALS